jgi:pilus assembly protein CpaF
MGNGIDGSMFALHATTPRDALLRLELLLTNAQPNVPLIMRRQEMAQTLHLIVQINILQDGWRKIQRISEVRGLKGGEIELVDIFEWVQTGIQDDGKLVGHHTATGYVPTFASQTLKVTGLAPLPATLFTPTTTN